MITISTFSKASHVTSSFNAQIDMLRPEIKPKLKQTH